jgi:predicted lactoylglutathione lyase
MEPKMIWANLGVSDINRTTEFYTRLGFKHNHSHDSSELTSILFGENGFVINFFLNDILQHNIKCEMADTHAVNEICFTLSAENKDLVDKWEKEVVKAGGKIISRPEEFGEGYYGFLFADPDGHRFNVFYMEGF